MIMKMSALCAAAALTAVAQAEFNPNLEDELTSLWELPERDPEDFKNWHDQNIIEGLTNPEI